MGSRAIYIANNHRTEVACGRERIAIDVEVVKHGWRDHFGRRQKAQQIGIPSNLRGLRYVAHSPVLAICLPAPCMQLRVRTVNVLPVSFNANIHHTPVHCRRRKIRCLLAPGDAQGRCENCIRLKKECNFYPVDQQPPVEKKSRSGSKVESVSSGPSSAPSPSFAARNVRDQVDVFSPYAPPSSAFSPGPHISSFDSSTPAVVSTSPFHPGSSRAFATICAPKR